MPGRADVSAFSAAPAAARTRMVIDACLALGFARAGVARAEPAARPDALRAWLAAGAHGRMAYMAERLEERLDVRVLLPGAQSVVMVADRYAPRAAPLAQLESSGPSSPTGRIARYARGRDYHRVIKARIRSLADRLRVLSPGAACRVFVDTAPVLEREHAARAALGAPGAPAAFIGKHTLLIDPALGSYLLLGGIVTTIDLAPSALPDAPSPAPDHCGTCTRCIDACPTSAITPHAVEATRCISYLTLEHDAPIDPALHTRMGDWIAGCDICQDVCPFNHIAPGDSGDTRTHPAYADDGSRAALPLLDMLGWTEDDRRRVLQNSAAKRASLDMLRRNAVIALGNTTGASANPAANARLASIAHNPVEPEMVRHAALAVLDRWQAPGEPPLRAAPPPIPPAPPAQPAPTRQAPPS